jgi:hypothetical protein
MSNKYMFHLLKYLRYWIYTNVSLLIPTLYKYNHHRYVTWQGFKNWRTINIYIYIYIYIYNHEFLVNNNQSHKELSLRIWNNLKQTNSLILKYFKKLELKVLWISIKKKNQNWILLKKSNNHTTLEHTFNLELLWIISWFAFALSLYIGGWVWNSPWFLYFDRFRFRI